MLYRLVRALLRDAVYAAAFILLLAVSAAVPAQGLTFQNALALAPTRAPSLVAREAAIDSASAASVSAGELPDPRMSVGVDNFPIQGADRFSLSRDFMTMRRIGLMQDVPNADKRRARVEVANARVTRARAELVVDRVAVQRETANAWINRYMLEKRLAAFDALERENRVEQDTINAQVASGKRQPADAFVTRQDAAMYAERRDELVRELAKSKAALRRWIGSPADEPLVGEPPHLDVDVHRLHESVDRHVEIAATAAEIDIARAELHEAQAGKRPDWGWEVSYQNRGGGFSDMVSFQVRIDLPIFQERRQDSQVLARQKDVSKLEAELENMRRRHAEELEVMLAERDELVRRVERLRTVSLPLQQDRVQLQLASYGAGKGDLGAVLSARKDLVETTLKRLEAEALLAATESKLAYFVAEEKS